jgi:hypothetical protein
MKRTFEDEVLDSPCAHNLALLDDVWKTKIMPILPTSALLALKFTSSNFKFLADEQEKTTTTEEDFPFLITDLILYDSISFLDWIQYLIAPEGGNGKSVIENQLKRADLIKMADCDRMDLVEHFKDGIIRNITLFSNIEKTTVDIATAFWLSDEDEDYKFKHWSQFLSWIVVNSEIPFLLDLMKEIGLFFDLIMFYETVPRGKGYIFSSFILIPLLILRNDERLLELYLDPQATPYPWRVEIDCEHANNCCLSGDCPKFIWNVLKAYGGTEKQYSWCLQNIPTPNNDYIHFTEFKKEDENFMLEPTLFEDIPDLMKKIAGHWSTAMKKRTNNWSYWSL